MIVISFPFHFKITGAGLERIDFNINLTNGVSEFIKCSGDFFENLKSLKTKFIFKVSEKRFILTSDFRIKFIDNMFYLAIHDVPFQEVRPNLPSEPIDIYLESIGKLAHLKFFLIFF